MAPILPASRRTNEWRARKRERKLKADSELLVSFISAFPGQMTVNVAEIEHEEYSNPVRIRVKFQEALRPAIVAFAHGRGMDVETLFDDLARIIAARAMPDRRLFLVE